MAKVHLIDYTGKGNPDPNYAARLLAFTKNTRLNMAAVLPELHRLTDEDLAIELQYMATTIQSSWEFVDVTFLIEGISRATAQQMTRTRTASFAMQSQRVTDMSKVTWDSKSGGNGKYSIDERRFDNYMTDAIGNYRVAVEHGMALEDARDLLPIGVHCNLVAKYNLRALVDLIRSRDSLRVQGQYRDVALEMKRLIIDVWPWSKEFFKPKDELAINLIEKVAVQLTPELKTLLAKAADLLKK